MVNPGTFQGSRKDFLQSQKADYQAGVVGSYAANALAQIQHKYLKCYLIDLLHNEEPSTEWLAAVDDDAAEEELAGPDIDALDEDELAEAMMKSEKQRTMLCYRKAVSCCVIIYLIWRLTIVDQQIKWWLAYQNMKDQDIDPTESGAQNPYRILLHQLMGTTIQKPCKIWVVNV